MYTISDESIERLIREDIPYFDLTTHILNIGSKKGKISFSARESTILAGAEEVVRIFNKLGLEQVSSAQSGSIVQPGEVFLTAAGSAEDLHKAWKVSLNILEYCSGIATRTGKLISKAKSINPKVEVVTTRKLFPGTKELAIKAVLAGGGLPHRLGLSETVLVFKQHAVFTGGMDKLLDNIRGIQDRAIEKKIIIETENREEALAICKTGIDGIQFDKIPPEELVDIVRVIRAIDSRIALIATGGINDENIADYAKTGVDVISTSWVYFGKPADIGVVMTTKS
jgi:molybdenum transport protein